MFLSGLHLGKASEKPYCCGGSVRGDELVSQAMFIFKYCPSYEQNRFVILTLGYKKSLVMSVQPFYQFFMKASARASIADSLLLVFRSRLNSLFCISC